MFESGGPGFSLEDAAALLIRLEPTDTDGLVRLRVVLEDLALEGGLPPGAQARVAGAARRVAETLAHEGDTAAESLAEAGWLIEEVRNLVGEGTSPGAAGQAPSSPVPEQPGTTDVFVPADVDLALLPEFIAESREYMHGAEAALLALELNPEDSEHINTIFRAFHTIKGTSAFLGLSPISEIAHHAESLFDRFRDGEIRCTGPRADVSLRALDMLDALLDASESLLSGNPLLIPNEYKDLLQVLIDPEAAGLLTHTSGDTEVPPSLEELTRLGNILVADGKIDREAVEAALRAKGDKPLGEALVQRKAASLTDVAQGLRKQQQQRAGAWGNAADATVRIRTDQLNLLAELVANLVAAHSMVSADPVISQGGYRDLARNVERAGNIVTELQDLSVSMCTVPMHAIFQKMSRVVRDVARKCGKEVEFLTEGENTEIDRSLAEVIGDPLVHMIRNAVDHGIEAPDEREAKGKPRLGTIRLAAHHSGGDVVIEFQDDGRGLQHDKILKHAIARGLVDGEKSMSEAEIFRLIFTPGFSTAEQVTSLSGRGVGMDVVERSIEAVGGRIEVFSEAGRSSTFIIRLPLTLIVAGGMLVRAPASRHPSPRGELA